MSYEVWVGGRGLQTRRVDEHEAEPPQQGDWIAYDDDGTECEAVVSEVRYIRQRDGSYVIKVFVVPSD